VAVLTNADVGEVAADRVEAGFGDSKHQFHPQRSEEWGEGQLSRTIPIGGSEAPW
jgi:hypothetical protein